MNSRADIKLTPQVDLSGWQAIDASASATIDAFTQEYAVGPTPVKAIKGGQIVDVAKSSNFKYGKYWYSLLYADVFHQFIELVNGVETIVGYEFQVNRYATIILQENLHKLHFSVWRQ